MQRFVLVALMGLCLAAYANAGDLNLGEREEGDVLVASRRLLRPAVPGKVMVAKSGFNTAGRITALTAVNAAGSSVVVNVVKGGIGQNSIVVSAIGERGSGMDVQLNIYAIVDDVADDAAIDAIPEIY